MATIKCPRQIVPTMAEITKKKKSPKTKKKNKKKKKKKSKKKKQIGSKITSRYGLKLFLGCRKLFGGRSPWRQLTHLWRRLPFFASDLLSSLLQLLRNAPADHQGAKLAHRGAESRSTMQLLLNLGSSNGSITTLMNSKNGLGFPICWACHRSRWLRLSPAESWHAEHKGVRAK